MGRIGFSLEGTDKAGSARAGRLTLRGGVEALTPLFMPVGTHASVRGLRWDEVRDTGATVVLANTYHLRIRPGPEVFRKLGGIHRFMSWDGAVLTDSGGFQIFSLPGSRALTEEGAAFKSYVDGRIIQLTPEESIRIQLAIGSDVMMVLDECVPSTSERSIAEKAMHRTHRWALRSLAERGDSDAAVFAIAQGALFEDLRRESAGFLASHPFDGYAIGGLAVGESRSEREDFTAITAAALPADKPRYLMGVGTPIDLLEAVHRGVDMFDCILPTAMAQHGRAYTPEGTVYLPRSWYRFADRPLAENCPCPTCQRHSRAYIHHLIKAGEGEGWRLIAVHNLWFYQRLTAEFRRHILAGTWNSYYREAREVLARSDNEGGIKIPPTPPKPPRTFPEVRGAFAVKAGRDGVWRIVHGESGEAMHPAAAPDTEAQELYVKGAGLLDLAKQAETPEHEPLVIWDVGLGAAHNAMAAIKSLEEAAAAGTALRPIRIHSFEKDMDALGLALVHIARFFHLRHGGPHTLVREGRWRSKVADIEWILHEGDFHSVLEGKEPAELPPPRLVYYDPFSAKTDGPMWTASAFKLLQDRFGDRATELWTYSTSTAVRSAMLLGGFRVAKTAGVGLRSEATVAYTEAARQERQALTPLVPFEPLDASWLERWERSTAKWPSELSVDERSDAEGRVRGHAQFN